jgi:hypothetical protein
VLQRRLASSHRASLLPVFIAASLDQASACCRVTLAASSL